MRPDASFLRYKYWYIEHTPVSHFVNTKLTSEKRALDLHVHHVSRASEKATTNDEVPGFSPRHVVRQTPTEPL
jgi:hypothetical protein